MELLHERISNITEKYYNSLDDSSIVKLSTSIAQGFPEEPIVKKYRQSLPHYYFSILKEDVDKTYVYAPLLAMHTTPDPVTGKDFKTMYTIYIEDDGSKWSLSLPAIILPLEILSQFVEAPSFFEYCRKVNKKGKLNIINQDLYELIKNMI